MRWTMRRYGLGAPTFRSALTPDSCWNTTQILIPATIPGSPWQHAIENWMLHSYCCGMAHRRIGRNVDESDRDALHQTTLSTASWVGNLEVAQLLIKYGVDVNSASGIGETPLHAASRFRHLDTVHLLLDYGADVNAKQMDGGTASHLAS
jgi:ankyrin repeat protein